MHNLLFNSIILPWLMSNLIRWHFNTNGFISSDTQHQCYSRCPFEGNSRSRPDILEYMGLNKGNGGKLWWIPSTHPSVLLPPSSKRPLLISCKRRIRFHGNNPARSQDKILKSLMKQSTFYNCHLTERFLSIFLFFSITIP